MYIIYAPPDENAPLSLPTTFCSCGNIEWESTITKDFGNGYIGSIDVHLEKCSGNNDCKGQKVLARLTFDDIRLNHMTGKHRLKYRLRKQYAAPHYPTTVMPFIIKFRRNLFPLENQLERTLKDVTKNS